MKPDEWPKYRYLLLELWRSTDPIVEEIRQGERNTCREQAFDSLHTRWIKDLCVELRKNEQDLTEIEWEGVFQRSYEAFDALLKSLCVTSDDRWTKGQWKDVLERPQSASVENDDGIPD